MWVGKVAFLQIIVRMGQMFGPHRFWFAVLWLAVLPVTAQEWCRYVPPITPSQEWEHCWVTCPLADSLSHVWFRQTYVTGAEENMPVSAHISFTSSGLVRVYVNECNVGTAQWYVPSEPVSIDITPYLNEDTNVVAVLYAPRALRLESRQLSLSYYGFTECGRSFCYTADSTWLCRVSPASGWLPDGGEWTDGREAENPWRASQFDPALWINAEETDGGSPSPDVCDKANDETGTASCSVILSHVQGKSYFDPERRAVNYAFGNGIYGQVRLTLRDAHCGEVIRYGRNIYICNGEMDEQAAPLFSLDSFCRVYVSGDRFFQRSQIWDIEALTVGYD